MTPFELAFDAQAELGEGPVWSQESGTLLWLDIYRALLHSFDPETGTDTSTRMPSAIGAVVPRVRGGLVAALADGFWSVDLELAKIELLVALSAPSPKLRINDGKCDSLGRFWAGTISVPQRGSKFGDYAAYSKEGTLYRLDGSHELSPALTGVTLSNGMDWSPDSRLFYYVDSATQRLDCFDFDLNSGNIGNRRVLVDLAGSDVFIDGMTVDAEGGIWLAVHGLETSCVQRYSASGKLEEVLPLPVLGITSCTFGGALLDVLFVTTKRVGLSASELSENPMSGGIFRCKPGAVGLPPNPYRG